MKRAIATTRSIRRQGYQPSPKCSHTGPFRGGGIPTPLPNVNPSWWVVVSTPYQLIFAANCMRRGVFA